MYVYKYMNIYIYIHIYEFVCIYKYNTCAVSRAELALTWARDWKSAKTRHISLENQLLKVRRSPLPVYKYTYIFFACEDKAHELGKSAFIST